MKNIYLKDMAYRKARVFLTIISVSCLVLLILLMGGMMNGLSMQAKDYVMSIEKQAGSGVVWVSSEKSGSTFAGFSLLSAEELEIIRSVEGVDKDIPLSPLIFAQARPVINGKEKKAVIVGYKLSKLGGPSTRDIKDPSAPFYPIIGRIFQPSQYDDYRPADIPPPEVIVDERLGLEIGQSVELSGKPLRVVGKTKGSLFVFDTPLLFMDIRTAQNTFLKNVIYINTMLVKVKEGYSEAQLANDIKSRLAVDAHTSSQIVKIIMANFVDEPMKGVRALRALLWLVAGLIVSMITYVTTTEKTSEIGVLKAIGASDKYVISMILKQVILTTITGVILGISLSVLFARYFPIVVLISIRESILVAFVTMAICCYGGYIAAKRGTAVDPMIAFRGR